MVLESLINPFKAEKRPWELFFLGMMYSSIAIVLSLWIFADYAGLVMIFLTVIACVPLMYSALKFEEEKDVLMETERKLLKEHGKALSFFVFLFIGMCVAYTLFFVFLPSDMSQSLFKIQIDTIVNINSPTGSASSTGFLGRIFFNNIKVLTFCILFAFFYGMGAIFILTWNASVIAAAIGIFIRNNLGIVAEGFGLMNAASYFQVFTVGFGRYFIHGIPEILGYFVGGLAGGILSVAVIRKDFTTKSFEKIVLDSSNLVILALFILFVAALIEVYITPVLF